MNTAEKVLSKIYELPQEKFRHMVTLVFLCQWCSDFKEEFNRLMRVENIGQEQLDAVNALMDKCLYQDGWADTLRTELARVGVAV